jgi:hypothetical protein
MVGLLLTITSAFLIQTLGEEIPATQQQFVSADYGTLVSREAGG